MDHWNHICSAPIKQVQFLRKEKLSRISYPPCPPPPSKCIRKSYCKDLFEDQRFPKPVFYNHPVELSNKYDETNELSYFEQLFDKEQLVGEGSFGAVYKVRSKEDDQLYAVKVLKIGLGVKYGHAEVKNWEKIGLHYNCVQYFMAWQQNNIIYLKMEYCQISLADYAKHNSNIIEDQLWEVLFDVLSGLSFLHKKKLIHLDLKPDNIMMKFGYYKITDFGLLVDLNSQSNQGKSTISDGDSKYLACEVLDGIYTYACDIFGLGISLLELSSNLQLPESGPLWHQIRKEKLPKQFYTGVSSRFSTVIEKMMTLVHWERPTADNLLKLPAIKNIQQHDNKYPRTDYAAQYFPNIEMMTNHNNNNNIVETPRRPIHKDSESPSDGEGVHRLPRVRLAF